MFDELTHPDEAGVHLQHPGLPPLALPLRLHRLAGGELHHRALGVLTGVVMCQYSSTQHTADLGQVVADELPGVGVDILPHVGGLPAHQPQLRVLHVARVAVVKEDKVSVPVKGGQNVRSYSDGYPEWIV